MAFNIGINVVEVDGRAAPALVAAPTSVAGFLVRSPRGVPDLPVAVRSFAEFVDAFGGYSSTALGAHALRGFFGNGGAEAYAVRVVGSGGAAASATLNDRAGAPTLLVTAGIRGRQDPGAWGNALSVVVTDHPRGSSALPLQIFGTVAEPFTLSHGATLQATVDIAGSATAATVTFQAGDFANIAAASAAEVARAINAATTLVRAGVTPDRRLVLSHARSSENTWPSLAIAGTAASTFGLTGDGTSLSTTLAVLQSIAGFQPQSAVRLETRGHLRAANPMLASITPGAVLNVTVDGASAPVPITFQAADFAGGAGAITPAEVVAAIQRQARGFTATLTSDQRLVLLSATYGTTSTIAAAAPDAATLASLGITGAAVSTPQPGTRTHRELTTAAEPDRLVGWTGALSGLPVNAGRVESVEFDLVVMRGGEEIERMVSLSMQDNLDHHAETVVNHQESGSRYIVVQDLSSGSGAGLDAPQPTSTTVALGSTTLGSDGGTPIDTHYIGDPAQRTGMHAFDPVRIQLLACPETTSAAVANAALGYCESRGDAMFVGTAPRGFDLEGIKTYAGTLRGRKAYGALYAPWVQIPNPLDTTGNAPRIWVPPVGHVLGVYARIADTRGVWKAPAGDEAQLAGTLAVEFDMTDTDHTDLVRNGGVNGIRAVPGSGIIIDSSRTLSTDTRWWYVGVRRLFNFVKLTLQDGLRWVVQEPHSEELRRMVKFNVITPFLLGLWRQGAFGSDPAEQVFTVVCDATNNPPADVNLGIFRVEVYFYPVKPAETIIIIVGQQESGATGSES